MPIYFNHLVRRLAENGGCAIDLFQVVLVLRLEILGDLAFMALKALSSNSTLFAFVTHAFVMLEIIIIKSATFTFKLKSLELFHKKFAWILHVVLIT